jgi:hypothetical protein
MRLAIMQPYFFPYIGYWQLINAVDKYVIYDDVNYIKNGWINRNFILLNGQKHLITLPLDGASPFKLINETKIISKNEKKVRLLKTLVHAYKKAPYYQDVISIVENTVMHQSNHISEALVFSIKSIAKYLNFRTEILVSSQIEKNNSLKGEEKVIDICKSLNADIYFNSIGGLELYSKQNFLKRGLILNFLKPQQIFYSQINDQFIPWLSIIDVMMFNTPETIRNMLNQYELI